MLDANIQHAYFTIIFLTITIVSRTIFYSLKIKLFEALLNSNYLRNLHVESSMKI